MAPSDPATRNDAEKIPETVPISVTGLNHCIFVVWESGVMRVTGGAINGRPYKNI